MSPGSVDKEIFLKLVLGRWRNILLVCPSQLENKKLILSFKNKALPWYLLWRLKYELDR